MASSAVWGPHCVMSSALRITSTAALHCKLPQISTFIYFTHTYNIHVHIQVYHHKFIRKSLVMLSH